MKVLHIIPTFYPATYWGGPIYSVYGLCNALAKIPNVILRVLTTDASGPHRSDSVEVTSYPMLYQGGYEVFFCSRWWSTNISPTMLLGLWRMIRWADVVHLTAVYSPPTIPTLLICRVLGKPIMWSPRGSLQRWEWTTKPRAKRMWEQACNMLLSRNKCVMHVTSEEEGAESMARISNAGIVVVPNGVNIPGSLPAREWVPGGLLRLLYLGRLHQIKGIENLLRAMKLINDETITLSVCGNGDEAYSTRLQALQHELGLETRVSFKGHVDGVDKLEAFMNADVCIVPSFTENFGMVVAESLAHGVPVIASQGTPWKEVETHGCGVWIENKPEDLAKAIRHIRTLNLETMGKRGRDWMIRSYGWTAISHEIFVLYERLLGC